MDTPMPLRKAIIYKDLKNVLQVVISRELDVPAATVNRIVSRFKCTGHTLAFRQGKCGRRRVLSLCDERLLSRASSKHPQAYARQLQDQVGGSVAKVSKRTVNRTLAHISRMALVESSHSV